MRESIPRHADKKSRVPKEERGPGALEVEIGVWGFQRGGKDKLFFFFSTFLSLNYIKWVFFFFFFFL